MSYNTPMAERTNIWGKSGCELPNGRLCDACCILPRIELEGTISSLIKPEFTPCPNLSEDGQGCRLHALKSKPDACRWHCSQTNLDRKLELISQAISSGIVDNLEANLAVMNLMRNTKSSVPLSFIIGDVYLNAENIMARTMPRPLISGEIDEP